MDIHRALILMSVHCLLLDVVPVTGRICIRTETYTDIQCRDRCGPGTDGKPPTACILTARLQKECYTITRTRTVYSCCAGFTGSNCALEPPSYIAISLNSNSRTNSVVVTTTKHGSHDSSFSYKIRLYENGSPGNTQTVPANGVNTFTGLTPGQKYQAYGWALQGSTTSSSISSGIIYTVPYPPQSFQENTRSRTASSASVTWSRPSIGLFYEYHLTISMPTGQNHVYPRKDVTNHKFSNLVAGRVYSVEISSVVNNRQVSSQIIRTSVVTVPQPPTSVVLTRDSRNPTQALVVTIRKHRSNDNSVVYRVRLDEDGTAKMTRNIPSSETLTFTGLTPGREYQAFGWSVAGDGRTTSGTTASGIVNTAPNPATNLQEISGSRTITSVSVKWSKPTLGLYEEYKLTISLSTGPSHLYLGKDITSHGFNSLQSGRMYSIQLTTLVDSRKVQSTVASISATTIPRPPTQLALLSSTTLPTNTLVVKMIKHNSNDISVVYKVRLDEDDTKQTQNIPPSGTSTFTGLTPGLKYQAFGWAVAGDGKTTSGTTASGIIYTAPLSPTGLVEVTNDRTPTSVTVQWLPPAVGYFEDFKITITPGGSKFLNKSTSRYSFSGLESGKGYSVDLLTLTNNHLVQSQKVTTPVLSRPRPPLDVREIGTKEETAFTVVWRGPENTFQVDGFDWTVSAGTFQRTGSTEKTKRTFSIKDLVPGQTYLYSVVSKTIFSGKIAQSDPQDIRITLKPAVIRNMLIRARMTSSIETSWTPPLGVSDSYHIRWRIKSSASDIGQEVVSGNRYTIAGLSPGVMYTIYVNAVSKGIAGNSISIDTETIPRSASAPMAEEITPFLIKVNWNTPNTTFDIYHLWISPNDGMLNLPISVNRVSPREHTFTSLLPGQTYTISIAVLSGMTQGEQADRTITTYPLPVTNMTSVIMDPNTAIISWSPDLYSIQDEYHVTYQGQFVNQAKSNVISVSETGTTLHDLHPGEKYRIEVQAVSHGQASNVSTTSAVTYPNNPIMVIAPTEFITAHSVKLEWMFNGSLSHNTGWRITYMNENGDEGSILDVDVTTTSVVVTDLLPEHNYTFRVHGLTTDNTLNATGFELIATTDTDECLSNPCENNGRCVDGTNIFMCYCVAGYAGKTCLDKLVKSPTLTSFAPHFGPEAGGTVITIVGENFITPERVYLGGTDGHQCDIRVANKSHIEAVTPPVNKRNTNVPNLVTVLFPGGLPLDSDVSFEFRSNPDVQRIYPLTTIVNGGTKLTIEGISMDAVLYPELEVTMLFEQKMIPVNNDNTSKDNPATTIFRNRCSIGNYTFVLCDTPTITLPKAFRPRNTTPEVADQLDKTGSNRGNTPTDKSDTVVNFEENDSYLTFYLGLRFDGLDTYRNLSSHSTLKMYSILQIHWGPKIIPRDKIIAFERNKPLTIKGTDMDGGLTDHDYNILIGNEECDMMELETYRLTCMPPQSEPVNGNATTENHEIMIHIGVNLKIAYGMMRYGKTAVYVWVLVGLVITLVLAGAIIAPIIVIRKRRERIGEEMAKEEDDVSSKPGNENDQKLYLGKVFQDVKDIDNAEEEMEEEEM